MCLSEFLGVVELGSFEAWEGSEVVLDEATGSLKVDTCLPDLSRIRTDLGRPDLSNQIQTT